MPPKKKKAKKISGSPDVVEFKSAISTFSLIQSCGVGAAGISDMIVDYESIVNDYSKVYLTLLRLNTIISNKIHLSKIGIKPNWISPNLEDFYQSDFDFIKEMNVKNNETKQNDFVLVKNSMSGEKILSISTKLYRVYYLHPFLFPPPVGVFEQVSGYPGQTILLVRHLLRHKGKISIQYLSELCSGDVQNDGNIPVVDESTPIDTPDTVKSTNKTDDILNGSWVDFTTYDADILKKGKDFLSAIDSNIKNISNLIIDGIEKDFKEEYAPLCEGFAIPLLKHLSSFDRAWVAFEKDFLTRLFLVVSDYLLNDVSDLYQKNREINECQDRLNTIQSQHMELTGKMEVARAKSRTDNEENTNGENTRVFEEIVQIQEELDTLNTVIETHIQSIRLAEVELFEGAIKFYNRHIEGGNMECSVQFDPHIIYYLLNSLKGTCDSDEHNNGSISNYNLLLNYSLSFFDLRFRLTSFEKFVSRRIRLNVHENSKFVKLIERLVLSASSFRDEFQVEYRDLLNKYEAGDYVGEMYCRSKFKFDQLLQ